MPKFTVTVDGQRYKVDAPDENLAAQAVSEMIGSQQPTAEAAPQEPGLLIDRKSMLATPIELTGQPAPEAQTQPVQPSEAAQIAGGALRGGATIGAGALAGAIAGAPLAGVGAIPGAAAGAAAAMMTAPIVNGINQLLDTNYTRPDEAMQNFLTWLGIPKAEMSSAKLAQAITGAVAEAGAGVGIGKALMAAAKPFSTAALVGETLASQPGQQMMGSAGAAAATQAAEQAGMGVPGQLLAGLGGGMLGSFAGAERSIAGATTPKGLREAEKLGLEPLTSQAFPPKTPLENALAKAREMTPYGTGSLLQQQEEKRITAAKDLLQDFGADIPGTDYLQELTKQLTDRRMSIVNKFKSMKMDVIDRLSATGKKPNVDRTIQVVDDEIKRLRNISETGGYDSAIAQLESFGLDVIGKDLSTLESRRKLLGLQFNAPEMATVKDEGQKSIEAIYGALREDMGDFIKSEGTRTDYTRWRIGNKNLSDLADELRDNTLRKVLNNADTTPEKVRELLFSQNKSSIQRLYDNLDANGRATARAAILRKAADQAGGVEDLNPNTFLSKVKKLEDETGIFFKKDEKRQLEGLTRALAFTKRAGDFAANPPTGTQLSAFGMGSFLTSIFGGVAGVLAATGLGTAATRIYESKPVRELLLKLPSVKAGSPEEFSLMKRLGDVLKAQTAKVPNEPQQESK